MKPREIQYNEDIRTFVDNDGTRYQTERVSGIVSARSSHGYVSAGRGPQSDALRALEELAVEQEADAYEVVSERVWDKSGGGEYIMPDYVCEIRAILYRTK